MTATIYWSICTKPEIEQTCICALGVSIFPLNSTIFVFGCRTVRHCVPPLHSIKIYLGIIYIKASSRTLRFPVENLIDLGNKERRKYWFKKPYQYRKVLLHQVTLVEFNDLVLPFLFLAPKTLNYLAVKSFELDRTWWRLF